METFELAIVDVTFDDSLGNTSIEQSPKNELSLLDTLVHQLRDFLMRASGGISVILEDTPPSV